MKWTSKTGPIKTKRFAKAWRNLHTQGQSWKETMQDGTIMIMYSPFGACRNSVCDEIERIGMAYGWTLYDTSYKDIMAEVETATAEAKRTMPETVSIKEKS
jgi:hypothetical protein